MVADRAIIDIAKEVRSCTTICDSTLTEYLSKLALKKKDELLTRAENIAKTDLGVMRRWVENHDDVNWVPPGGLVAFPEFCRNATSMRARVFAFNLNLYFISSSFNGFSFG